MARHGRPSSERRGSEVPGSGGSGVVEQGAGDRGEFSAISAGVSALSASHRFIESTIISYHGELVVIFSSGEHASAQIGILELVQRVRML